MAAGLRLRWDGRAQLLDFNYTHPWRLGSVVKTRTCKWLQRKCVLEQSWRKGSNASYPPPPPGVSSSEFVDPDSMRAVCDYSSCSHCSQFTWVLSPCWLGKTNGTESPLKPVSLKSQTFSSVTGGRIKLRVKPGTIGCSHGHRSLKQSRESRLKPRLHEKRCQTGLYNRFDN